MSPQFFETRMGQRFYERDVPELIEQLKRIAEALERLTPSAPPPPAPEGGAR